MEMASPAKKLLLGLADGRAGGRACVCVCVVCGVAREKLGPSWPADAVAFGEDRVGFSS